MRFHFRSFVIGFAITLFLCIGATIVIAHFQSDCGIIGVLGLAGCSDDTNRVGFPLVIWEEDGFAYHESFNPGALLVDLIVVVGTSTIAGLIYQRYGKGTSFWGKSKSNEV